MPASISPKEFPDIGIECNEFAFLPAPCDDKESDYLMVLQGPAVPCHFEKPGSAPDCWSSGATTPGEESELEDQSEYEFNPDGQEDYYDFLREMGCDFKQAPECDEEEDDDNELDEEGDVEFTPDGQEDYYDFLREMGCPLEARVEGAAVEEEGWDTEEEEEVWDEKWNESTAIAAHRSASSTESIRRPDCSLNKAADTEDSDGDCDFGIGQRFGHYTSIASGPSPFLQKALLNVAAQRKRNG